MLTADQTAVLRHLVALAPVSHNANDVSRHLGMDVATAVLCLQQLRRLGYARYGKEAMGDAPEHAVHVPTDAGRKYLARTP
jgi:hypothetical protein